MCAMLSLARTRTVATARFLISSDTLVATGRRRGGAGGLLTLADAEHDAPDKAGPPAGFGVDAATAPCVAHSTATTLTCTRLA